MPLTSLRESLARSKARWKQRLHISPSHAHSPHSSAANLTVVPSGTLPSAVSLTEPIGQVPTGAESVQTVEQTTGSETVITNATQKEGTAWPVVRSLLTALESSADAFGPLKTVISGLNRCTDIFETASNGRSEYDQLRVKFEGLLADIAKHAAPPMEVVITDTVKRLCTNIEEELRKVEEVQTRDTGRRVLDAMKGSDEILESYRRVQSQLERLMLNVNMDTLNAVNKQAMETKLASIMPSRAAVYNSAESDEIQRGNCTPGTREQQIDLLLKWARDPETGRTCWMNGMAGTGKTTIAYTVCNKLDSAYKLGASFFCSRTIPECRQVKYIIPSIAYQLARFSFPFRCGLVEALESDPDAHTRALNIQYERLIVGPMSKVEGSLPPDFIVVIDALDECENENSVGNILDILLSTQHTLPIRFLVSSRPEPEISRRMSSSADGAGDTRLVLHDLDEESVKSDIETYMKYELKHITIPEAQWSGLLERCGVLFIYASTTCRYLEQAYATDTIDEALSVIMGASVTDEEHDDDSPVDGLYLTILTAALNRSGMSQANKRRMREVLETVICAAEPMTLGALGGLLGLGSIKQVEGLLQPLRSVLNIQPTTRLVTTLHASFPDFMLSPARSKSYHCNPSIRQIALAKACLRTIENVERKFNICDLASSYLLDSEVTDLDLRVKGQSRRHLVMHAVIGQPIFHSLPTKAN